MEIGPVLLNEIDGLVTLMEAFSTESGYDFSATTCRGMLEEFLKNSQLGQIGLLRDEGTPAGYITLCHGFSFMHGGRETFIDEVYVAPAFRQKGWGRKLLQWAQQTAPTLRSKILHLEVEDINIHARGLYEQLGFRGTDRRLMSWIPGSPE